MLLELHAHTCEVSPCALISAKELVQDYKKKKYDGIVITNHFDSRVLKSLGTTKKEQYEGYLLGYQLAKEEGDRLGITVILGLEIHLDCGPEDYLVYGIDKDFIWRHMDLCQKSQKGVYEICHEEQALFIQAHPFRRPCQPQDPAYLDGVEWNHHPNHKNYNEELAPWLKKNSGYHLLVTHGSDCHEHGHVAQAEYWIPEMVTDSKELAEALRMVRKQELYPPDMSEGGE